jgi:hypothetical protein
MSLPREPFSWSGDEDRPIPLDGSTHDQPDLPVSQILSEAETVVRDAQEAIGRQDTAPTITIPVSGSDHLADGSVRTRSRPSLSRRSLAVTLTLGCALAFLHGWSVGASATEHPPARSCDAHHCPVDPSK